jgi:hypothetical protein
MCVVTQQAQPSSDQYVDRAVFLPPTSRRAISANKTTVIAADGLYKRDVFRVYPPGGLPERRTITNAIAQAFPIPSQSPPSMVSRPKQLASASEH